MSAEVDEVAFALAHLALSRHCALVVLARSDPLDEIVETGQVLDAVLSSKLLLTLFHPKTPLHDGAVVVVDTRIVAASCYLPLTDKPHPGLLGTRHRAALGLSEETDALVAVVSEETGEIRLADRGRLLGPFAEEGAIRSALRERWSPAPPRRRGLAERALRWIRRL